MDNTVPYKFKVYEEEEGYYITYQRVEDQEGKDVFVAYNLDQCPEDAIIGRELFNAGEYIEAVQLGMNLAAQGYNCIEIDYEVETDNG